MAEGSQEEAKARERSRRTVLLNQGFRPSAPIDSEALFAGRHEQLSDIGGAIATPGQHVIVFGERGVGKTSLANIAKERFGKVQSLIPAKVSCDGEDDFRSVWRKLLAEIPTATETRPAGFTSASAQSPLSMGNLAARLPKRFGPNDLRIILKDATPGGGVWFLLVIDEFDRLKPKETALFADTIKLLSDNAVPATVVLVGIAGSVDGLLEEHASVERALVQVSMPRMSLDELRAILEKGLGNAGMGMIDYAKERIVQLSQGLPHYTHLLGLLSGNSANDDGRLQVDLEDVGKAIKKAVEKATESIKRKYHEATLSPRHDNLYVQALLACALARTDARGYFSPSSVREPMSRIMGRPFEIPAFSRHLNDFASKRGPLLEQVGSPRRYRFRFVDPLMQPYVIMRGLAATLIREDDVEKLLA